jgi:HlyD family secretion protein
LGYLEPVGEIIRVSATTSAQGSRVEELRVKEGDQVQVGQIIAVLDSHDRLLAALHQAQEQVQVAQADLARVQAGAPTGDIEAQKATIAQIEAERRTNLEAQNATVNRLAAELDNANTEYQRYQELYNEGAISASLRDSKQLEVETAQRRLQEAKAQLDQIQSATDQKLKEAKATLDRVAEVRGVDIDVATAQLGLAQAAVEQAIANLEQSYVRAPQAGQILDIFTRPGELISTEGIVELGHTNQMYVRAEVYQSDIAKVQVGRSVRVRSDSLTQELEGRVDRLGLQVKRQEVVNADPTANIDARIVEVWVKLDPASSVQVKSLTNLQVEVAIQVK